MILIVVSAFSLAFLLSRSNIFKDLSSVKPPRWPAPFSVCGCKGKTFFLIRQTFFEVFFKIFSGCPESASLVAPPRPGPLPDRFVLESGCKSTAFRVTLQMFSRVFCVIFYIALIISEKNFSTVYLIDIKRAVL